MKIKDALFLIIYTLLFYWVTQFGLLFFSFEDIILLILSYMFVVTIHQNSKKNE